MSKRASQARSAEERSERRDERSREEPGGMSGERDERGGPSEPIEEFLDELYARLRTTPRQARRVLTETEAHLREAADAGIAAGRTTADAQREAVRRFGPAAQIAAACGSAPIRVCARAVAVALARMAWLLAGAGLLAVGLSGLLAAAMNHIFGRTFVGDLPHTYPAAACRHFLDLHPGARGCAQAAVIENSQDAVSLRVLAGLAGLVLLAVAWLWRRWRQGAATSPFPDGLARIVALVASGVAAALLIGQSVDLAVVRGSGGVGYYLSGGIVAALICVACALPLLRRVTWAH